MDYFLNSENGTGAVHVTEQLPARFESTHGVHSRSHLNERRTRDSVGINAPETIVNLGTIDNF